MYENLLNSTDKSAKSGHFGGGFLFIAFNKKVSYNVAMEAFYGKNLDDILIVKGEELDFGMPEGDEIW